MPPAYTKDDKGHSMLDTQFQDVQDGGNTKTTGWIFTIVISLALVAFIVGVGLQRQESRATKHRAKHPIIYKPESGKRQIIFFGI